MSEKLLIIGAVLVIGVALFLNFSILSMPRNHGHVEVRLLVGDTEDQPLIVAFGGSEGDNVFASDQLKQERDKYLSLAQPVISRMASSYGASIYALIGFT